MRSSGRANGDPVAGTRTTMTNVTQHSRRLGLTPVRTDSGIRAIQNSAKDKSKFGRLDHAQTGDRADERAQNPIASCRKRVAKRRLGDDDRSDERPIVLAQTDEFGADIGERASGDDADGCQRKTRSTIVGIQFASARSPRRRS